MLPKEDSRGRSEAEKPPVHGPSGYQPAIKLGDNVAVLAGPVVSSRRVTWVGWRGGGARWGGVGGAGPTRGGGGGAGARRGRGGGVGARACAGSARRRRP